ncbi:MAG: helix-turn-helix domain-containing protein [Spirulinaceae cyanobacterium]
MMKQKVQQRSSQRDAYARLGERLRQIRLARNLSIEALHVHTRVPRDFIQALEAGQCDRFPEAVYVHYLILRLGIALDLANIQKELPEIQPAAVIPSWRNPSVAQVGDPVFMLNLLQIQLGGILLLTGTACGLSWAVFTHLQAIAQENQPENQPASLQHLHRQNNACGLQFNGATPELGAGVEFSCGAG